MEVVVLVVLAAVIALVAIDAIARLDQRGQSADGPVSDDQAITTQKIIVDLTKRR